MNEVEESIFRHSDIRGVYPSELNEETAYKIGRAIVSYLKAKKIIVGHDMRNSSKPLYQALSKGIIDQGADVIYIGLIDTPALYFSCGNFKIPGITLTASHNPAKYNGIKIVSEKVIPIGEENGLMEIKKLVLENKFKEGKKGKIKRKNIYSAYKRHIFSFVKKSKIKNLKIVIDTGNGIAGKFIPFLLNESDISYSKLYFKLDGSFPNHIPNPLVEENTIDLQQKVITNKADFGVGFDGDADRVFFIDEKGNRVTSSIIGAFLISHLRKKSKNGNIIYNSQCSNIVKDTAKSYNLKSYIEKVGHAYIKLRMREKDSFFAVEHSGHYYFKDNFYSDSAFIAFLIVCEIFSDYRKNNKKLTFSEMLADFYKYYNSEEINFKCKNAKLLFNELSKKYSKDPKASINYFDGLTVIYSDHWFSIRKSGNENLIRLNIEATTNNSLIKNKDYLLKIMKSHN